MCEFCKEKDCTLTKDEVIKRGPIIENNATGIMRLAWLRSKSREPIQRSKLMADA